MSALHLERLNWRFLLTAVMAIAFGIGLFVSMASADRKKSEQELASQPDYKHQQQGPVIHMESSVDGLVTDRSMNPNSVLYDQYDNLSQYAVSSQNFEPGLNAFDDQAADDFVVPVGQTWLIDRVEVSGSYAGSGPADSVNVYIYTNAGGVPGTPLLSQTDLWYVPGENPGDMAIYLNPPATLSSGTYWLSVQANQDYDPNGQWFWRNRLINSGMRGVWRNPGNGFLQWRTSWTPCWIGQCLDDLVFRLEGRVPGTPAPTLPAPPPTSTALPTGTPLIPTPVQTQPAPFFTPVCDFAWRAVSSPNGASNYNQLTAVAAASANDVWAVGNTGYAGYDRRTLIERWNGSQWSVVPHPTPGAYDHAFAGVAAISADDVWSVGYYYDGFALRTLTEHWNGSQWSIVGSPNVGPYNNNLKSVAKVASNYVWAVGDYQDPGLGRDQTLIMGWDGNTWNIVPSPNVGAQDSYLNAVSAVSANDAWAVGYYWDNASSSLRTLTMRWNGSQWSIVNSPDPSGLSNYLYGVAAISATDVWAVGTYTDPDYTAETLTMHWNGSQWSVVESPSTTFYTNNLFGVTAVSPDEVWAVGSYGFWSSMQTLIMRWDGSQWRFVNSANPSSSRNFLFGIAAAPGGDLWAVGYSETSNPYGTSTLVERYNDPCGGTPSPTATPPNTATNTPTETPSSTPTSVPTNTATHTPTNIPTDTPTATPTSCPIQFSDVPQENPFYPNVRCMACKGIISGYADGTFRPNNDVTRGQLSKIVAGAAGFNEPVSGQTFEDVPPSHTFYGFIERMATRGIIGGYPCGGPGEPCNTGRPYFRPGANATRGQISKIVSEAKGFNDPPAGQTFEDVPASNPFYVWIERLASRGIMGGYPCGAPDELCVPPLNRPYFRWGNNATRGQTSKIVANTFFPNCSPR